MANNDVHHGIIVQSCASRHKYATFATSSSNVNSIIKQAIVSIRILLDYILVLELVCTFSASIFHDTRLYHDILYEPMYTRTCVLWLEAFIEPDKSIEL